MNKKQMRDAVHAAIQFSDERDVDHLWHSHYHSQSQRQWARLDAFLTFLATSARDTDSELTKQINDFRERVLKNENPLVAAALDAQEESK